MQKIAFAILVVIATAICISSCKKDYYTDSGVHNPTFNGTILEYLKTNKVMFDTTLQVIKLAGMEEVLDKENVTFFAPTSSSIVKSVRYLNQVLFLNGQDTVKQYTQIKPSVWRKVLAQYIFKGTNKLKDYPQLDTLAFTAYPGQAYGSYDGEIMNVGVIFNDAGGVKYSGYRQLYLSYIQDRTKPTQSLINVPVATSDIQPTNGVIHVLRQAAALFDVNNNVVGVVNKHNFGFSSILFANEALAAGINPAP
ncbi:fasciclin domain-containing protein [Pedobacter heparinus]|uniref:fasciclin domain-containing protein n=1 Tax=Pedobacter heparinus TaxID=984 RepID=UPI00292F1CBD|nr:fasciclin domain-containing protein [Pedobacter heparinus]